MLPSMTSSSPLRHVYAVHMHARLAAHCHGLDLVREQRAVISSSMHEPPLNGLPLHATSHDHTRSGEASDRTASESTAWRLIETMSLK
jgi:hypothetical protein